MSAGASERSEKDCGTWFPDFSCSASGRDRAFAPPMSMPYLFEEPFITSGLQVATVWHQMPERSIFQGGDIRIAALQMRLAVTDRLALIATRDGYVRFDPDLDLVPRATGFADMTFGLKYALVDRPDSGFILTPHLRFEMDSGEHRLFQGQGDGSLIPGVSFGWAPGNGFYTLGALGAVLPLDGDKNSTYVHYNLHVGYRTQSNWVPFVELNGMTWTSSGDGSSAVPLASGGKLTLSQAQRALASGGFEGFDYANLGSRGVAGNDMITGALGVRFALGDRVWLGFSYEHPITQRKDLFQRRFTVMASYEF
jgi:hypothetical protein